MIDVRRLEALVAVHRTGSVSAAAASLHYGQPTVSHHLRRLEAETGSVLLQRVGRGVRLTGDGQRLARRGEEILGLLERAEAELAAATQLRAGHVRLAAFPSAAATLVPTAIAHLADRHPDLTLDLVEAEPPEAAELLRAGEVDLALTFAYPGHRDVDGVSSTPLFDDPLYLVAGDGADLAGARRDGLGHLAERRWITGCERCRAELLALCEVAGFAPRIAFASDDYVAVQSLVAGGVGVTVLPGLALRAHRHPDIACEPLAGAARQVRLSSYGAPPRPVAVEAVAQALIAATPG
ncbi:LysR family transcriptional regulator [Nocardioides sp. GY 10113]|uniref:LysR family transcriptional regulator n=1 Tax=Nocardioides sp. GY 10113 TaxID=2569761 RepID=UPI0010A88E38|nr:LysR family transcriptional regulator [Nocardioides sp. GY 10113]TIC87892.1 LysR family transcriptional regulator [Nocardioides sp. GY 10113]